MSSPPTSASVPIPLLDRMEETPLRVVLLGKTGSGKSSFGNTLMGENVFEVNRTPNSGTSKCQAATKSKITVIDTPGFFDNRMDEENLKPEIIKSIIECSPGPHAFVILLKVEKYTEHEKQVITKIKEYFSDEVFKYAVLVFAHGDQLDEGETIKDFVSENKDLRELSEKCGGRCHVIDNKYWNNNQQDSYRNNQFRVKELLNTIKEMVKRNGGGCYTNELLGAVERNIKHEQRTAGSRKKAKLNVLKNFLKKMAHNSAEVLIRAFLGFKAMIRKVFAFGCCGDPAGYQDLGDLDEEGEVEVNTTRTTVVGAAVTGVAGARYLRRRDPRGSAGYDCLETDSDEEVVVEVNTARTTGESSSKLMKPKNQ